MRYLFAIVPFALLATLSAQTPGVVFIGGQQPPAPPWDALQLEFEVASVKVNKSGPGMMAMRTIPSSFNVTNVPLRLLITQAYRLSGYQLVGGPSWLDSERFDILAKALEGARPDQTMLMRSARGAVQAQGARRNAGDAGLRAHAGAERWQARAEIVEEY